MSNPRWVTVAPDGTLTERDDEPTLDNIGEALGGNLELLPDPRGVAEAASWINRDGQTNEGFLPMNPRGTAYLGTVLWPGVRVSGTIALTGEMREDDVIADIPAVALDAARKFFGP